MTRKSAGIKLIINQRSNEIYTKRLSEQDTGNDIGNEIHLFRVR